MASDANGNYIEGTDAADFNYYPDGAPAYTTPASTGGFGMLTSFLNTAGGLGTGILSTLGAQSNAAAQQKLTAQQIAAQRAQTAATSSTTKLLLIGGAVLAAIVVLVMVFRGK